MKLEKTLILKQNLHLNKIQLQLRLKVLQKQSHHQLKLKVLQKLIQLQLKLKANQKQNQNLIYLTLMKLEKNLIKKQTK